MQLKHFPYTSFQSSSARFSASRTQNQTPNCPRILWHVYLHFTYYIKPAKAFDLEYTQLNMREWTHVFLHKVYKYRPDITVGIWHKLEKKTFSSFNLYPVIKSYPSFSLLEPKVVFVTLSSEIARKMQNRFVAQCYKNKNIWTTEYLPLWE